MPFVVVYDANALYGNAQRDLLIRIAQSGLVQARWTDQILDEMLSNPGKKRPDIPPREARHPSQTHEQGGQGPVS
jgi:hypothetical protein